MTRASARCVPDPLRWLPLFLSLIGAISCSPDTSNHGDLAFVNARAYTVDESAPWAESVVVKDDEIIYVGDASGADSFIGPDTDTRDLGGQLLLPGFVEAHMHFVDGGRSASALVLTIDQSIEEWVDAIARHAAEHEELPVIYGYGFIASAFGMEGPTRQLIDAVVPDKPVLIMDEGWHTAWVNTAALEAMNITQDTPDPVPGFSYFKRDANGDATGYLLEDAAFIAEHALNEVSEYAITDGLIGLVRIMNSQGITTVFDAATDEQDHAVLKRVLDRVEDSGNLSLRVFGAAAVDTQEQIGIAVNRADEWRRELRGERFHYNALKIFNDGTLEARTAAMFADYQNDLGNSGQTVFTEQQLTRMITEAASRDLDVHVHALGELAIHEALNAIEMARREHPDSRTRYTLIHIEVIAEQDVPRFGELNVIAQTSPLWFSYDDFGKQFVSDNQFKRYWPVRSLEETGATLAFGSDFPATGFGAEGMHPLFNIEIGHTRQIAGVSESPVQPREDERLSVESLVKGYTIGAAHMLHMEDEIGSIEVGKKADLVVLDRDIFDIDPYSIHKTNVVLTVMDGDIVYEADLEALQSEAPRHSDIKRDEHVVLFRTAGWFDEDAQAWHLPIHGWIYEPEDSVARKAAFAKILEETFDLAIDADAEPIFASRVNLLISDNERGKTIVVDLGGRHHELAPSAENGHFGTTIVLSAAEADEIAEDDYITYEAVTRDSETREFRGQVKLVPPAGLSVISDIDDTVKITGVTDKKTLLEYSFLQDFVAAPGMAELYRDWAASDVSFHFVSSSPWQLYAPLSDFLDNDRFPRATFSLKSFRFRDETLLNLFKEGTETKPIAIEAILETYPDRQFVLVGDSGEQDPEVYAELMRKHPAQILRVYIRNVTQESPDDPRFTSLFAGIDADRWQLFDDPQSLRLPLP